MDTIVEMYQESVERICLGLNDDHDSSPNDIFGLITFDAVDTENIYLCDRL